MEGVSEIRFRVSVREMEMVSEVTRSLGITKADLARVALIEYLRSLSVLSSAIDKDALRRTIGGHDPPPSSRPSEPGE